MAFEGPFFSSDDASTTLLQEQEQESNLRSYFRLRSACSHGQVESVKQILAQGIHVRLFTNEFTPLHACCDKVLPDDIDDDQQKQQQRDKLLATRSQKDTESSDTSMQNGCSKFISSHQNNCEIVKLLLQANVDVNAQDHMGRTPLHLAAAHGNLDLVEILLAHGANLSISDRTLETPLHVALRTSAEAMKTSQHIRSAVALDDEIHPSLFNLEKIARTRNVALYMIQSEKPLDINADSLLHGTALHHACASGDLEMVKVLVDHGAHINLSRLIDERTPLHMAVCGYGDGFQDYDLEAVRNSDALVRYLVQQGASIGARDFQNHTPCDFARKRNRFDALRMMQRTRSTWDLQSQTRLMYWKSLPKA